MMKIAALVLVATFVLTGLAVAAEKEGMIQAINPATREITLEDGSKLAWDANTQITIEGQQGKLQDLKQGERVRANYEERDGKAMATTLDLSK